MKSQFIKLIFLSVLITIISSCLIWFTLGKKLVAQAVSSELAAYDNGVLTKIKVHQNALEQAETAANQQVKQLNQDAIDISNMRSGMLQKISGVQLNSGTLSINTDNVASLNSDRECKKRGLFEYYVAFKHKYTATPVVVPSFTLVDFGNGKDHRLKVKVLSVDLNGFTLDFNTWCDTKMSRAEISWIAIGV